VLGFACFALSRTYLSGWGHTAFHGCLAGYAYYQLASAHAIRVDPMASS
jgi:hypothetical protein